jgi:hypothetical protein
MVRKSLVAKREKENKGCRYSEVRADDVFTNERLRWLTSGVKGDAKRGRWNDAHQFAT